MDGVLLIDKATKMTSHDVVALVRRVLGIRKVGHCGTLDPLATGLLMLTIGRGTKIQDLLMSEDKEYSGTMKLGIITDSQDAEGKILERHPVPSFDQSVLEAAFRKYDGDFYQIPPMISAIKKEGVPLYKLARAGKIIEREPRFVRVYAHQILAQRDEEIDFRVVCSKGFYVRTYVHDIGGDLGCGAYLQSLRRIKSGRFCVDGAFQAALLKETSRDLLASRIISLPEISRLRGA